MVCDGRAESKTFGRFTRGKNQPPVTRCPQVLDLLATPEITPGQKTLEPRQCLLLKGQATRTAVTLQLSPGYCSAQLTQRQSGGGLPLLPNFPRTPGPSATPLTAIPGRRRRPGGCGQGSRGRGSPARSCNLRQTLAPPRPARCR